MINKFKFIFVFTLILIVSDIYSQTDTNYITAPPNIRSLLKKGKPPTFTIQLSGSYNIGLFDLSGADNTRFWKNDFVQGRSFGTRYGLGVTLLGKLNLHKEGNVRLVTGGSYNRFQSDLIITGNEEGRVHYNAISWILGLENCFTPDRKAKPVIGFDIVGSFISGAAELATDSTVYNLDIKSSFRLGFDIYMGFEYAVSNNFGLNLGTKISNLNVVLKKSEMPTVENEIELNDAVKDGVPYSGWKQFGFFSIYGGINFYFGMRNKN